MSVDSLWIGGLFKEVYQNRTPPAEMILGSESSEKDSLRDTLLSTGSKEIFECEQTFEPPEQSPFLSPEVLSRIFLPTAMDISQRLQELKSIGGLTFVMNGLKVWHQAGLSRFSHFLRREELYGTNSEEHFKSRRLINQVIAILRSEFIGLFLLLCVISVAIDFGLYQRQSVWIYLSTLVIALVIIKVRLMVKNYLNVNIFKSISYSLASHWVNVRREGRVVKIQESRLLVGDILLFGCDDNINVDGILIKAEGNLVVDEYKTITEKFNVTKTVGWNIDESSDPFMFSGCQVISGAGEMLVCCVGEQCTFRTVTRNKEYLEKKTRYIREGEGKYLVLTQKAAQVLLFITIYLKLLLYLVQKSPLELNDVPNIAQTALKLLSWSLMIQQMQRIDYLHFFVEMRTEHQREFRIINKQVVAELLKLDILLIEDGVLEMHEQHLNKQDRLVLIILKEDILAELNTVVDLKIITEKSISKCKEFGLRKPYAISRDVANEAEIMSLEEAKFICHLDPAYYTTHLVKVFSSLNYQLGVVPLSIQEKIDERCIIIATDDSEKSVQDACWVKLNSATCEEGLKKLYLISTNFYILLSAFMNHNFLSLFYVFGCLLFVDLPLPAVLFMVAMENVIIHLTYKLISLYECTAIETAKSFQSNFVAHHLTIIPFFVYGLYTLQSPKNVLLFFVCRNIMSLVYNTRMGSLVKFPIRLRFFLMVYLSLGVVLLVNLGATWVAMGSCREELSLFSIMVMMNLIYLAEKNYNNSMRTKPNINFN